MLQKERRENIPVTRILPEQSWWRVNVGELWEYRELLYFLVWRDLKVRYKQTAIGAGWAILQPLLTTILFAVIFGKLAKISSYDLPYMVFYLSALLPWTYFASSIQNASNIIIENQRVITKVYFPRILLPMSAALSGLLDFGIGFVILLGFLAYYRVTPAAGVVFLPLTVLAAVLVAGGVGMFLSALNALYRDVRYAVPFIVQLWMFASPVVYPLALVPARWQWIYGLNPMALTVEAFRWSLTGKGYFPSSLLVSSGIGITLSICAGIFYFRKIDATIADRV